MSLINKSTLHYILLQPESSIFQIKELFLYLTNEDISKLDISISEIELRKVFNKRVGVFYNYNAILCRAEFARIVKRNTPLLRCELDFKLAGKLYT